MPAIEDDSSHEYFRIREQAQDTDGFIREIRSVYKETEPEKFYRSCEKQMVNELICFFFCADIANIKDMVGDKRFAGMCLTCVRLEYIEK